MPRVSVWDWVVAGGVAGSLDGTVRGDASAPNWDVGTGSDAAEVAKDDGGIGVLEGRSVVVRAKTGDRGIGSAAIGRGAAGGCAGKRGLCGMTCGGGSDATGVVAGVLIAAGAVVRGSVAV